MAAPIAAAVDPAYCHLSSSLLLGETLPKSRPAPFFHAPRPSLDRIEFSASVTMGRLTIQATYQALPIAQVGGRQKRSKKTIQNRPARGSTRTVDSRGLDSRSHRGPWDICPLRLGCGKTQFLSFETFLVRTAVKSYLTYRICLVDVRDHECAQPKASYLQLGRQ
jgi:hypothetical protein